MQRFLTVIPAVFLSVLTGSVQAQLPDDWRSVFEAGEGWQLGCDASGRGRACLPTIYYFNPEEDEAKPDEIVVGMVFSMSRGKLYIQPWQGTCVDGEIKVDGKTLTDLAKSTQGCVPHGGRPFMYLHEKHNFYNISTLAEAEVLDVTLVLDNGATIQKSIPLNGFEERFEEFRGSENSGSRGGRRR